MCTVILAAEFAACGCYIRLQPLSHTVPVSITYGHSLYCIRLQAAEFAACGCALLGVRRVERGDAADERKASEYEARLTNSSTYLPN